MSELENFRKALQAFAGLSFDERGTGMSIFYDAKYRKLYARAVLAGKPAEDIFDAVFNSGEWFRPDRAETDQLSIEEIQEIRQAGAGALTPAQFQDVMNTLDQLWKERIELQKRVESQRKELSHVNEQNRRRTLELDALHFVWCDGGCEGGVHRWQEEGPEGLTEEIVKEAEHNTKRLVRWYHARQYRQKYEAERQARKK